MSITHRLSLHVKTGANELRRDVSRTAGHEIVISESIPTGTVGVNCPIDVDKLKSIFIVSDRNISITTGESTLNLFAGVPVVWFEASGVPNPFVAGFDTLEVTNSSGATALLQIFALLDPT